VGEVDGSVFLPTARRSDMKRAVLLSRASLAALLTVCCLGLAAADGGEVNLADLQGLHAWQYRIGPCLRVAQSLQAVGKEKACARLREVAAKERWPYVSMNVLCRMLFKAKPGAQFQRAGVGLPFLVGDTRSEDWSLEPVAIVDGVPFLLSWSWLVGGEVQSCSDYLEYCIKECDWNDFEFTPKSKEQQREALKNLLSSPALKDRASKSHCRFLEKQTE
jgi:hypothetical protein